MGDGIFSCNLKAEGVGEDCPGAELAMSCRTPACVKGREQSQGKLPRAGQWGSRNTCPLALQIYGGGLSPGTVLRYSVVVSPALHQAQINPRALCGR